MASEEMHEQKPWRIALATEADMDGVVRLQQANLGPNLSEEQKHVGGHVTVETNPKLLKQVMDDEGVIVARDKDEIVGYIVPLTLEHARELPVLDPFVARFRDLTYKGKNLNEYKYCILGQICVDQRYRGQGMFEELYKAFAERFADKYDLAVTEVGANNPRSLHAHTTKAGLDIAETYQGNGREWYILIFDMRSFKKHPQKS